MAVTAAGASSADAQVLRARIRALPGIDRLLAALEGLPPAFLVGGAVRDLLRGEAWVDLDLAVEGDARAAARELAARLGGEDVGHERFGTATVRAGGLELDLATTRRERYPRPGALPAVEAAPLAEDLGRRDFTINAMAASLSGTGLGRLHDPHGGQADLGAGLVRILHPQSFVDDPTRLLRAVRYTARLGFAMAPETADAAREAIASGALGTVSGARIGDELIELLAEPEVASAVRQLVALGLDRALHPVMRADPELAARVALGTEKTGADRGLAVLASLVLSAPEELAPWLDELHLEGRARVAVARAARTAPNLATELRPEPAPSAVHELLAGEPPEALALALALGAPAEPVERYLSELRHVGLEISGDDLIAAGVRPSPALGDALRETLRRKRDGEVSGRAEELELALELARRVDERAGIDERAVIDEPPGVDAPAGIDERAGEER